MSGELITADGQMQYRSYLLGDDEVTIMEAINGWDDIPPVDSGNTNKPSSHGAWSGRKLMNQRIITWEGSFAPEVSDWNEKLTELRDWITIPVGTEEYEIVVRMHGESFLAFGAVSARALPGNKRYGAYGPNLFIQFECSDPRRYSLTEYIREITFPVETTNGLTYPLTHELDYGEEPNNNGILVNAGNIFTPVVIEIQGNAENPQIQNVTMGIKLKFNITLTESETLTIDTRTGTVYLNDVADRLYTRSPDSAPILDFGLQPGQNLIKVSADSWSDPATASITWRDATI